MFRRLPLTDPDQITPFWLAAALRRSGALDSGGVESIECEPSRERAWSRMTRIRVRYVDGSSGELPERLMLKLCGGEGGVFDDSEVRYYTRDYIDLPDAPIVRCFDAVYQESPRRYHLLLEDLSPTHANCDDRDLTPSHITALADAVARLHVHRWGADRLGAIGLTMPGRGDFARYMDHVGKGLEPLLELACGEIDPSWSQRLPAMFAQLVDRYTERARHRRGITKIHGDLNPGNILAPLSGSAPIYLIDHQPFDWSLTRWLGVSDLVYAMVLYWDTPTRRTLEMPLLERYHVALTAGGISDYTFDHLLHDYRLCIVESVAAAVEWCVLPDDRERMWWLWSRQLQRGLAAYEDLGCGEMGGL